MDVEKLAFDPTASTLPEKFAKEGLTFDDVLLVPAESSILPNAVSTATRLTRTIVLEVPVVSAAMDTVTEARMAIALAREGGLGIVQRNLSIDAQVAEIDKVKRSEAGMIVEPVTLPPDALVSDAVDLMERYHISGVPITDDSGKLVGILTNRDLRFERNLAQPVSALMTSHDLVTAPIGTTLGEAERLLHRHRIEKLPIVDDGGCIKGLITVKDNQQTLALTVGQIFTLDLGAVFTWDIQIGDPQIIARVADPNATDGAPQRYRALAPGQTELRATGDPRCRRAQPACMLPSIVFHLTIIVT